MADYAILSVRVNYSDYQRVTVQLPKIGVTEDDAAFETAVTIRAGVLASRVEEVTRLLTEMTGGRALVEVIGHEERPDISGK